MEYVHVITGNKTLDTIWIVIAFLISVAWIIESFGIALVNYNWLSIFVFWMMLGFLISLFSKHSL